MGTDDRLVPNARRRTPNAAVETLAALEELALRDLRAQTERLRLALGHAAARAKVADDQAPEHGAMTRARMACMDALELYSHAQGARAAAEQRARWRREEEDGDGDGRD